MKFFGAVRQKKFERKLWYSLHPHMSSNFFDTRSFVKRSRVSPTKCFGTARQKKSTEVRDVTPFIMIFFDTLSLWNTEWFPYKNFRHYGTINFRWKNLATLSLPPLIIKIFRWREFSATQHRIVPIRSFAKMWEKQIWRKLVISALFFIPNFFRNLKLKQY